MNNMNNMSEIGAFIPTEMPKYVFLGGTCNGSTWRDELMPMLTEREVTFFNPVVEDWTEEAKAHEDIAKENATWELYVITPEMTGVYSIAEIMYKAATDPNNLIICVPQDERWTEGQWRSLTATTTLARKLGLDAAEGAVTVCSDLKVVAEYLKTLNNGE